MHEDIELPPCYENHREDRVPIEPPSSTAGLWSDTEFDVDGALLPASPLLYPLTPQASAGSSASAPALAQGEKPPEYIPSDPRDRTFAIHDGFICSESPHAKLTPRYQLSSLLTKTAAKPYRLRMRRINPRESRRLSISGTEGTFPCADFDNDLTLYLAENINALRPWGGNDYTLEIKGCNARAVRGHIEMILGPKMSPRVACRFYHMIRNEKKDSMREENQRRMRKYGYRPQEEWDRQVLFSVDLAGVLSRREYEWKDGRGKVLAVELEDKLEMRSEVDGQTKDAMLACWASRLWMLGAWR